MPLIKLARGSCGVFPELGNLSKAVSLYPAHDDILTNLNPGVRDEAVGSPRDSEAQTARDPTSPQHVLRGDCAGRQSACIRGLEPAVSTAQEIHSISSMPKRLMCLGKRPTQANTHAGGRKRTASRATVRATAASAKKRRRKTSALIGSSPPAPAR